MDASKLKNIAIDLCDNYEYKINELLGTLLSNISAGDSTEISKTIEDVRSYYEDNTVNDYTPSNLKILEKIGGINYFGNTGYNYLTNILGQNSYNVQKTTTDLQKYIDDRIGFLDLMKNCKINLDKLNVVTHYYKNEIFEVGLLFPKEVTGNKITNITKELNKWDKVFKSIKELNGDSVEDTEIDFINNGSLEFFINNNTNVAIILAFSIQHIVSLYKKILDIRIAKDRLKDLGITIPEQKGIEKQEKEILKNGLDEIAVDLVKQFASKNIEEGRINELTIAFKGHTTYIAKCIDKGMIIEINPPEIVEPKSAADDSSDEVKVKAQVLKDKYNVTLEKIDIVQKAMSVVKELGKTGVEIMNYLSEGDEANLDN